ncbi:MAG TPA: PBP1A family penicillin-binding protein [Acholeplasmataceae bacterium]|nr:PBP1A family penicillin-binding protein [Acholeplasmataceae bacterium]
MKILLKLTKYIFLIVLALVIIIVVVFIYYSQKLNFTIPKKMDVEIYDTNGTNYLTLNNENKQSYVEIDDISQHIIDCIISIEDKKFYKHKGIDVIRIGGALVANLEANNIKQGASTITQQYARMLYLTGEKKVKRKIEEALIAMNLETKYSKNQILEGYLNMLYFDHGVYGIKDACKFYFNKLPSEVTLAEAAVLTAIPKGPAIYSPLRNPENNKERKELIIKELYEDKKITKEEMEEAINEEITFYGKIDKTDEYNAPYFQDIIVKELKKLNIFEKYDVKRIKVYTTLDLNLTKIINDAIKKYYPEDSNMQLAIYAMDPKTGNVLSVIGGVDYTESTFNRATDALRQPGSTIKPFLYYAALNNGFTPITTFHSSKTEFFINGKSYAPQNFANIYPNQDVTMAYAISTSDNIYAIKTHLFLGTHVLYNTLLDFDFSTPILNTPSLALGTSEVKLSELTTGYARFASLGTDVSPKYIEKITDEKGNIIYLNNQKIKQKYNQKNCYILSETMTNVFDNNFRINISATGAPISGMLTRRYAAKTGTTDYDAWVLGYNKDIVLGIWCGYDDNSLLRPSDARFIKFLWAECVEDYMAGKPYSWYEPMDDVVKIRVNPINGKLAQKGEYEKELFFDIDNIPWYIFEEENNEEEENEEFPDLPDWLFPDYPKENINN